MADVSVLLEDSEDLGHVESNPSPQPVELEEMELERDDSEPNLAVLPLHRRILGAISTHVTEDDSESNLVSTLSNSWWVGSQTAKFCAPLPQPIDSTRLLIRRTVEFTPGKSHVVTDEKSLAENVVRNQKYNPYTFIFVVLFNEFKFFFNLYFLLVALSQFIPQLQIGYLFTYVAPLVFVLTITIAKEAYDDIQRWKRDREANGQIYQRLLPGSFEPIPSSEIRVGDLILVQKNERIPADMILLRTSEKSGASFIRTDQLDGETDWKLRKSVPITQKFPTDDSLLSMRASLMAERPRRDIYAFVGKFVLNGTKNNGQPEVASLSLENTLWMNTVLASGTIIGCVIYTGDDTRCVMNTSAPATKVGLLDLELNRLSKILAALTLVLAFMMVALGGFKGSWGIDLFRFLLLFSSIIPISLRVSLDMGKALYSYWISHDDQIPNTLMRTSNIPEELGRISYLLSDKTGTLTQNEMIFKRLHLGITSFNKETVDDLQMTLRDAFVKTAQKSTGIFADKKVGGHKSIEAAVRTTIEAIALCHNVTPVREGNTVAYQASSPDEVALVQFTESVGMTLWERDLQSITLKGPTDDLMKYDVLNVFPFTSETKRMGIIVRSKATNQIAFYMKGADVVMQKIVNRNDWLDEECDNMAREGLRTLVFGMRYLSDADYANFLAKFNEANTSMTSRDAKVQRVVETIEKDLDLIGLSGVEDKLQENVKPTLEMLRNAGIRIWMLTGDKIETATNIAISARLVGTNQETYSISNLSDKAQAFSQLNIFSNQRDCALIIDGKSLQLCMENYRETFAKVATKAPAVVCCRCSPTQKAEIVTLIKEYTKLQTCAIGDGGNDVSMIQAADIGIGIVGKEGKQASLAADISIEKFHYIRRLIIWHGRNSYKRSARLGQFVIHRGLIISFIQAVFSALFYFASIAIYNGWLMVGYATYYTTAPVFSLVYDTDVSEEVAFQFPELYRELQKGRSLSFRTFFVWVFKSVYQGGVIMQLSIFLFDQSIYQIVSITFTTLILTELINVALEINNWHWLMVVAEVLTVVIYFVSIALLGSYFDLSFMMSGEFVWKVIVITLVTTLPVYLGKFIQRRFFPASYSKLS